MERCVIWANVMGGLWAEEGDPTIIACSIRDHTEGEWAHGIRIDAAAAGTTVADCVFARNAAGVVVREEFEAGGAAEEEEA